MYENIYNIPEPIIVNFRDACYFLKPGKALNYLRITSGSFWH